MYVIDDDYINWSLLGLQFQSQLLLNRLKQPRCGLDIVSGFPHLRWMPVELRIVGRESKAEIKLACKACLVDYWPIQDEQLKKTAKARHGSVCDSQR